MRDLAFSEADRLLLPLLSDSNFVSFVQLHAEAFVKTGQKLDRLAQPHLPDHSRKRELRSHQYEEVLYLLLKDPTDPQNYYRGGVSSWKLLDENKSADALLVRELLSELGADDPLLDSSDLRFLDNPIRYKLSVRAAAVALYLRVTRDSEELWPDCARKTGSPLRRFVDDWEVYDESQRIRWFGRIDAVVRTVIADFQQTLAKDAPVSKKSQEDWRAERDDALLEEFGIETKEHPTYGELHEWLEKVASARGWEPVELSSIRDCLLRAWDRLGRGPWPFDGRGRKRRKQG